MKEFELTFRIRNNLLVQKREELGMDQKECAQAIGISYGLYAGYETLRRNPLWEGKINQTKEVWKPTVLKIAEFYGVSPEDLFPGTVLQVKKNKVVKKMDFIDLVPLLPEHEEMAALAEYNSMEGVIDSGKLEDKTREVIHTLKPREEKLIRMRFGIGENASTLKEIAEDFNVTNERIRQMEAKALRKLRHPSRSKQLRSFVDADKTNEIICASSRCDKYVWAFSPEYEEKWESVKIGNVNYAVCSYGCARQVKLDKGFMPCSAPSCQVVEDPHSYYYEHGWYHFKIGEETQHTCSQSCARLVADAYGTFFENILEAEALREKVFSPWSRDGNDDEAYKFFGSSERRIEGRIEKRNTCAPAGGILLSEVEYEWRVIEVKEYIRGVGDKYGYKTKVYSTRKQAEEAFKKWVGEPKNKCPIPKDTRCEAPECNKLVVKEESEGWYWWSCKIDDKEYKVCSHRCARKLGATYIRKE